MVPTVGWERLAGELPEWAWPPPPIAMAGAGGHDSSGPRDPGRRQPICVAGARRRRVDHTACGPPHRRPPRGQGPGRGGRAPLSGRLGEPPVGPGGAGSRPAGGPFSRVRGPAGRHHPAPRVRLRSHRHQPLRGDGAEPPRSERHPGRLQLGIRLGGGPRSRRCGHRHRHRGVVPHPRRPVRRGRLQGQPPPGHRRRVPARPHPRSSGLVHGVGGAGPVGGRGGRSARRIGRRADGPHRRARRRPWRQPARRRHRRRPARSTPCAPTASPSPSSTGPTPRWSTRCRPRSCSPRRRGSTWRLWTPTGGLRRRRPGSTGAGPLGQRHRLPRRPQPAAITWWTPSADSSTSTTRWPLRPPRSPGQGWREAESADIAAALVRHTRLDNLTGLPAISLPIPATGPRPVGLHLTGRTDRRLLDLAASVEAVLSPPR